MGLVIILVLLILGLAFLPQIWVRHIIKRYGADRPDFPGTGGEFARHILDKLGLSGVGVEETQMGDHYDPEAKMVRLSPEHHRGRSLSAVVIAAHEVGHAVQDARSYFPLKIRNSIVPAANLGSGLAFPLFFIGLIANLPFLMDIGIIFFALAVAFSVVTLPVEFNASRRAIRILADGRYLTEKEIPQARKVLSAAALTYVAATTMAVLNLVRLLILRGSRD